MMGDRTTAFGAAGGIVVIQLKQTLGLVTLLGGLGLVFSSSCGDSTPAAVADNNAGPGGTQAPKADPSILVPGENNAPAAPVAVLCCTNATPETSGSRV